MDMEINNQEQQEQPQTCITYDIIINNVSVNNNKKYYLYKITFTNPCLEITKTYFGEKIVELNEQLSFSDDELKSLYDTASVEPKIMNGSFTT